MPYPRGMSEIFKAQSSPNRFVYFNDFSNQIILSEYHLKNEKCKKIDGNLLKIAASENLANSTALQKMTINNFKSCVALVLSILRCYSENGTSQMQKSEYFLQWKVSLLSHNKGLGDRY